MIQDIIKDNDIERVNASAGFLSLLYNAKEYLSEKLSEVLEDSASFKVTLGYDSQILPAL